MEGGEESKKKKIEPLGKGGHSKVRVGGPIKRPLAAFKEKKKTKKGEENECPPSFLPGTDDEFQTENTSMRILPLYSTASAELMASRPCIVAVPSATRPVYSPASWVLRRSS